MTILSIDIEKYFAIDLHQYEKYTICNATNGLTHLREYGYYHYKLEKYFKYGFCNKVEQLEELASTIDTMSTSDKDLLFICIKDEDISRVLISKSEKHLLDQEFWSTLADLRKVWNKKMRIFCR